jgi:predicted CXXCH cytochrome family protein
MNKLISTAAGVLAATALVQAASIVNSKHDIRGTANGSTYDGSSGDEICIYCHTPHNPHRTVPLWNRNNPTSEGWSFYKSPTLTAAAQTASFNADSISLFCLSCHDGSTSVGAYVNKPTGSAGADNINYNRLTNAITAPYANIAESTKNLSNDHPVGFSYTDAQFADSDSQTGGLKSISDVKNTFGIGGSSYNPFFTASPGKTDQMECSSCHKVHDPGTSHNFLRIENEQSKLCLACHNK